MTALTSLMTSIRLLEKEDLIGCAESSAKIERFYKTGNNNNGNVGSPLLAVAAVSSHNLRLAIR